MLLVCSQKICLRQTAVHRCRNQGGKWGMCPPPPPKLLGVHATIPNNLALAVARPVQYFSLHYCSNNTVCMPGITVTLLRMCMVL